MPIIEVDLPLGLLRDIRILAKYHGVDTNTFILWAIAEKIGEVKGSIIDEVLKNEMDDSEPLLQNYPSIQKATPSDEFILNIVFEDGLEGQFNAKPLIIRDGVFSRLSDPEIFKTVKVAENGKYIYWDKDITLGSDTIYIQILLNQQY
jgi:hypothetical protein